MKVFALIDNADDEIVGVSEDKSAVKLFMQQNDLSEKDYSIEKYTKEEGDELFAKYADTKQIVYVSKRDIVSIGRHADAIFETINDTRYDLMETMKHLNSLMNLNIEPEEIKAIHQVNDIIKRLLSNDEALEDALRNSIIFYLSRESETTVRENAFLHGKDY